MEAVGESGRTMFEWGGTAVGSPYIVLQVIKFSSCLSELKKTDDGVEK